MASEEHVQFLADGDVTTATIDHGSSPASISVGDEQWLIEARMEGSEALVTRNGRQFRVPVSINDDMVEFALPDQTCRIARHHMRAEATGDADGPGALTAPMPGKILDVLVQNGQQVTKGDPLIVMEAMKMEQTLTAGRDGVIADLSVAASEQVADSALLLNIIDPE